MGARSGRESDARRQTPVTQSEASIHVEKVLQSAVFHGSETLRQLLLFLAKSTAEDPGRHPKEHEIAVGVLGRGTDFDPRVDSVVRVQVGRLRSKLAEYYVSEGSKDEVILQIPKGEYRLYFLRRGSEGAAVKPERGGLTRRSRRVRWGLALLGVAVVIVAVIAVKLFFEGGVTKSSLARQILPWSVLLRNDRRLHLVVTDPDIAALQALFSYRISLSDYANKRYLPDSLKSVPCMPDPIRFFRGVNVSSVAFNAAMVLSALTVPLSKPMQIHTPRNLQLADIKTDDDFVLVGSPRSNPWSELFADHLDFYFERQESTAPEVIVNRRPKPGESSRYVPSAAGWETGDGYAILAFVGNPGQLGHALLLAGTNAESTEAATKLALNLELLSSTLTRCGVDPKGPPRHFEVLLKVRTMAGSPSDSQVIACHRLPN